MTAEGCGQARRESVRAGRQRAIRRCTATFSPEARVVKSLTVLLPQPSGSKAAVSQVRAEVRASGFKRVTAPADGAGRRLGRFGHRQHLHELACFLVGHLTGSYGSGPVLLVVTGGLVSAARATAARRE